jgi:hypothetical protein
LKRTSKIVSLALAPALLIGSFTAADVVIATPAFAAEDGVQRPDVANQIFNQINSYRVSQGLAPLQRNTAIDSVAQNWSQEQYNRGLLPGHNPSYTTQIPSGYTLAGENVAYNSNPNSVVAEWIASDSHRAAIIANFTSTGIGVYQVGNSYYYTQNFANYPSVQTITSKPAAPTTSIDANGHAVVNWTAPAQRGNSAIVGYDVTAIPTAGGNAFTVRTENVNTYTFTNLPRGRSYNVTVRAVNGVGASQYSNTTPVAVPAGAPDAPTIADLTPTADGASFALTGDNGGAEITSYNVTIDGVAPVNSATSPVTVTGLRPGTRYTGNVTATNSVGTSTSTAFSFETAKTIPSGALDVNATLVGDNGSKVTWTAPESDGGAAIQNYTVSFVDEQGAVVDSKTVDASVLSTSFTGLAKNINYTINVVANNSVGASMASAAVLYVPSTLPSPAQNVTAELTDEQQITVNWAAPTDNGGNPVTGYVVNFYANGSNTPAFSKTVGANELTAVLTEADGVNAATNYTVKVAAVTSFGTSKVSSSSNEVAVPKTPTKPAEVTAVKVTPDVNSVKVSFAEPTDNGGAAITGYTVKLYDADTNLIDTVNVDSPQTVTFKELTRGTNYSVDVLATNKKGSSSVTTGFITLLETPSAPQNVEATLNGYTALDASWDAPADNGGGDVTYVANLIANGQIVATQNVAGKNATFKNLDLQTDYTVTVVADNGQHKSAVSTESNAVTTPTPPSTPQSVTTNNVGTRGLSVVWNAPQEDGTLPVTDYTVTAYDATTNKVINTTENVLNDSLYVEGLNPGTSYYFAVTANSPVGSSAAAKSEVIKTKAEAPGAVNNLKATVQHDTSVKVSWTPPTYNGGAEIRNYSIKVLNENQQTVAFLGVQGTDWTFDYLQPNQSYTITVSANNEAGVGPSVTTTAKTNPVRPEAVQNAMITADDRNLTVSYDVPFSDGGTAISNYKVELRNAATGEVVMIHTQSYPGDITFSGVDRNANYYAAVYAINAVGSSPEADTNFVNVPAVAPSTVGSVNVALDGSTAVVANWTAPTYNGGATVNSYNVSLYAYGNDDPIKTVKVDGKTLTTTFANLDPASQYVVAVSATNSAGTGALQSSDVIKTKAIPADAPTDVVAKLGEDNTTVTSTWTAPVKNGGEDVVNYTARLLDAKGNVVATQTVTDTTVNFTGLTRGAAYQVSVIANNSAGASKATVSASVTIPAVAPDAPTKVATAITGTQSVKVTWAKPSYNGGADVTGYIVTLTPETGDSIVKKVSADETSVDFLDLQGNTQYAATVAAVNSAGNGRTSSYTEPVLTAPTEAPAAPAEEDVTLDQTGGKVTQNGTTLTVQLVNYTAGQWVYGYAYSTALSLGWAQVDANGVATFSIANADLEPRTHKLAVLDADGNLITSGPFVVLPAVTTPPTTDPTNPTDPTNGGGNGNGTDPSNGNGTGTNTGNNGSGGLNNGGNTNNGTANGKPAATETRNDRIARDNARKDKELAYTGQEGMGQAISFSLAMLLAGAGLVGFARRRKNGQAED